MEHESKPKYFPLSVREKGQEARNEYEALVEVPPIGLERAFALFIARVLIRNPEGLVPQLIESRILAIEQALHVDLHPNGESPLDPWARLPLKERLDVLDFCLHNYSQTAGKDRINDLREAMVRARFAYTIELKTNALVRVLAPGIEEGVLSAFGVARAKEFMVDAVKFATGLNPDETKAFDCMVRAVEAVALPALIPNDSRASLGKAIGHLRSPGVTLNVKLPRNSLTIESAIPTQDVIRGMMQLVWSGYERHQAGGSPPDAGDAQSLLGVAGSLVVWFGEGFISKA